MNRNGITDVADRGSRRRAERPLRPAHEEGAAVARRTIARSSLAAIAVGRARGRARAAARRRATSRSRCARRSRRSRASAACSAFPLFFIGFIFGSAAADAGSWTSASCSSRARCSSRSITLPVEFNASKRALAQLHRIGALAPEEVGGAKKVLDAAALTYVAAAAMAALQLLRLLRCSATAATEPRCSRTKRTGWDRRDPSPRPSLAAGVVSPAPPCPSAPWTP